MCSFLQDMGEGKVYFCSRNVPAPYRTPYPCNTTVIQIVRSPETLHLTYILYCNTSTKARSLPLLFVFLLQGLDMPTLSSYRSHLKKEQLSRIISVLRGKGKVLQLPCVSLMGSTRKWPYLVQKFKNQTNAIC